MSSLETSDKHAGQASLENLKLIYGPGMQKQWEENTSKFLLRVGARFGPSVLASIKDEEVVVTEVDSNTLPKFKTTEEETDHVEILNHFEMKVQKQDKDNYFKFSRIIRQNLATTHGVLLSLYDDGLKKRLGTESEFQEMIRNKIDSMMKLNHLVKKI